MSRELSPFLDLGFHGDKYLIDLLFAAAGRSVQFIETGTNVGSSLHYFAKNFPAIRCFSCEPDDAAWQFASAKTRSLPNVRLYHQASPDFLHALVADEPALPAQKASLFWLDSHGYGFRWPLADEVAFITQKFAGGFLFIDDFLVPGQPQFLYDEYDGQICSFDAIAPALAKGRQYRVTYPSYRDKTSPHHPLKGWVLIDFGQDEPLAFPGGLHGKIAAAPHAT